MRQAIHPCSTINHKKPNCYEELVDLVRKLSMNMIHVRVDFYIINNKPIFGEYTFFHHGGLVPFIPNEYDLIWGQKLKLHI